MNKKLYNALESELKAEMELLIQEKIQLKKEKDRLKTNLSKSGIIITATGITEPILTFIGAGIEFFWIRKWDKITNRIKDLDSQIKELSIQLAKIESISMEKTPITIQGGIVVTGGGTVNAPNSVNTFGGNNQIAISSRIKEEIIRICKEIDKVADEWVEPEDVPDIKSQTSCIIRQLKQDYPKKNVIKSACDILKGILVGVAANQITPLVDSILKMLGA